MLYYRFHLTIEDGKIRKKEELPFDAGVFYDMSDLTSQEKETNADTEGDPAGLLQLAQGGEEDQTNHDIAKILAECNDLLQGYIEVRKTFQAFLYRCKEGIFYGIAMIQEFQHPLDTISKEMTRFFTQTYGIDHIQISSAKEIRGLDVTRCQSTAYNRDMISPSMDSYLDDMGFDYMIDIIKGRTCFKAEEVVDPRLHQSITLEEVLKEARNILVGPSMMEELDRIYSKENSRHFLAHPVHYKVVASSMQAAEKMIRLLVQALRVNGRLCGDRVTTITNIEESCDGSASLENLLAHADGSSVILQMTGNDPNTPFAEGYTAVVEYLSDLIGKYRHKTLFFFVELTDRPGFATQLVNLMAGDLDLIEIKEGDTEDIQVVAEYMKEMAEKDEIDEAPDFTTILPEQPLYALEDIYKYYNKWKKTFLRNDVYKAYRTVDVVKQTLERQKGTNYQTIQNMVGLTEAKEMMKDIIAFYNVEQLRTKMGIRTRTTARHMCFTGNPGTAKTTMARLIAGTLREKGMLQTGRFVECGRKDLVGKYVGWTADIVAKKFKQATGGVLFIDEAYALAQDPGHYGGEAINTIVQEMENHRDNVIVIFAGYPDKMKTFLETNEGLRSRIAFHLDFPDYTADEMDGILALMAKEYEYNLSKKAKDKAHDLFAKVVTQKDFGNGRYVRNVLEHAMLNQAGRLTRLQQEKGELTKRQVKTLEADDFTDEFGMKTEDWKPKFGFGM